MRFVLRRAGFFLLTLWAAVTLNFFLPRLMPGNPALAMMGKFRGRVSGQALQRARGALRREHATRACSCSTSTTSATSSTGNFGTSLYYFPAPVGQVVLDAIPWTLGLVGVTTILAFVLGTGVGIVAAWRRGGAGSTASLPPCS